VRIGDAAIKGVTSVTSDWTKYRKKELKSQASGMRAWDRMMRGRYQEASQKDIAFEVMETAYMKASANGTLPAAARQIMYQARPLIMEQYSKELGNKFDHYFTQKLLPIYVMNNPVQTANWDVVYDARGHLWEPHTGYEVPLGTIAVRDYLAAKGTQEEAGDEAPPKLNVDFPTFGDANRFQTVLFIEKEGFMPLLKQAQIAERYDVAIMSTKGVSSTAARTLVEKTDGVRFLVFRDFDKGGFSIAATLKQDTWRYQFTRKPNVIDVGLRLTDVEKEGLSSEDVTYKEHYPEINLRHNGATEAEIKFLVTSPRVGQRVELNAFASDHFLRWLEQKLVAHDVKKIIPDSDTLTTAYRRALFVHRLNAQLEKLSTEAKQEAEEALMPPKLKTAIEKLIKKNPAMSWDAALAEIAAQHNKAA
jgi:hypothetical protein